MAFFRKFGVILLVSVAIALLPWFHMREDTHLLRQPEPALALSPSIISPIDAAQVVSYRRQQMRALSAHYRSLEAIIDNNAPFQEQIPTHVRSLLFLAQHLDETFPAGTAMDEEEGWGAKPLIWEEPENFAQIIHDFQVNLETLQATVKHQAPVAEMSNALGQVRQQCLACHDIYRVRQP